MNKPSKTPILKDIYTNSLYQSTFLPIFAKAETRIKTLIFSAFLLGQSKYILMGSIGLILAEVEKKIPQTLHDRDVYIKALKVKSANFVKQYYDKPQAEFQSVKETIIANTPVGGKAPILNTPKETITYINKIKPEKDLWAAQKGSPNVVNYEKELKAKMNRLAAEEVTTQEPGKKPISLWQKAELDVRYENQMQQLQNLRVQGIKYCWLSSHPNASKRCSKWQGSLVAIEGHASNPQKVVNYKTFNYAKSSFAMEKVDGKTVYSLPDIMDVVDSRYGYHNNIICGFNCRHRLIPYKSGTVAPQEYTEEEMKKQREIERTIRAMERQIRLKKTQLELYNKLGDKKAVATLKKQIKKMVENYKTYCETNGYAWHQYRIEV